MRQEDPGPGKYSLAACHSSCYKSTVERTTGFTKLGDPPRGDIPSQGPQNSSPYGGKARLQRGYPHRPQAGMEFTPNPLAGFSKLIYRARKASGEFEFSILHLENQSVMQEVFTVYGMKWMANPHPRDLWRVSVFSWLVCVGGSYLGGGAGLFLHPHPISQEGCSPCSLHWHTGWRGQAGPWGGDGVFVLHMAEGQ